MKQEFGNGYTLTAMTIVAALCGFFIVSAYQYTRPFIVQNQRKQTEAAAMAVLPGAVRVIEQEQNGVHWFVGFDRQGKELGISIQAEGRGFADQIKVLYAYQPVTKQITGFKVIESKETPGIGDKILSDSAFLANFRALPVECPLEAVKHGKKTQAHQIDGITGATISSKAVAKLLQQSLEKTLPVLIPQNEVSHVAP